MARPARLPAGGAAAALADALGTSVPAVNSALQRARAPAGGRLDTIRLQSIRANGHPALAAYLPADGNDCRGYGIMVLTLAGGRVATITGFPDPDLFPLFGLPPRA